VCNTSRLLSERIINICCKSKGRAYRVGCVWRENRLACMRKTIAGINVLHCDTIASSDSDSEFCHLNMGESMHSNYLSKIGIKNDGHFC